MTAIVDNCPPGLSLTEDDIQPQLTRRRPGQSAISTPRNEVDRVEIQSGTENGLTLGTPIALRVLNEDQVRPCLSLHGILTEFGVQRPHDYKSNNMDLYPRPSHADWTYVSTSHLSTKPITEFQPQAREIWGKGFLRWRTLLCSRDYRSRSSRRNCRKSLARKPRNRNRRFCEQHWR